MKKTVIMLEDGSEAVFLNESRNTRSGFAHDCDLHITFSDGSRPERIYSYAYYLNRTWEAYPFQSVMRSAVYELAKSRKNDLLESFKKERGYKRLTAKRSAEFTESIKDDYKISVYRELLDRLNYRYSHGGFSHPAAAECF